MFYKNKTLKKTVTNAKINFTNFEKSMDTEIDEALNNFKNLKDFMVEYMWDMKEKDYSNVSGPR